MTIYYWSNRKLIKWLNAAASSVLEWDDAETYVLNWLSEFLEVGIKSLVRRGDLLEKQTLYLLPSHS